MGKSPEASVWKEPPVPRRSRAPRLLATGSLALACLAAALVPARVAWSVDEVPTAEVPTAEEVAAAEQAAAASADDLAEVRAFLVSAKARLDEVTITAAQAGEAYNGARYRSERAEAKAAAADAAARKAAVEAEQQRADYQDALVTSYQLAPELQAWSAVLTSDGIGQVIERSATLEVAEDALGAHYDELAAARAEARRTAAKAEAARARADRLAERAKAARDAAYAAEAAASAELAALAAQEQALVQRWSELAGISLELAQERADGLAAPQPAETPATASPSAPANGGGGTPTQPAAPSPTPSRNPGGGGPSTGPSPNASPTRPPANSPTKSPTQAPTQAPTPTPTPTPTPPPVDPDPPAPGGGASAAIAFARKQLGEPYRWGAAGPNAWDCSGLTMGAWAAGGKSLPHYSVAQYQQSTPISRAQLRPGDLVFWGSSNRPTSIYHVALYVGNGRIIHAPRTGRPVAEESIHYWIAPNFFARP